MIKKKKFVEPELVKYEESLDKVTLQPYNGYNGTFSSETKKVKKPKKK